MRIRHRLADGLEQLARAIRPKHRVLVCAARPSHVFEDPDPKNPFKAGVLCPACQDMGLITVGVCHPQVREQHHE